MGFLNDMKKLLWAKKAIAKNAVNNTVEAGKEAGEELKEKAEEMYEKAKEKAEDVGEVVKEKATDAMYKASDLVDDLGAKISRSETSEIQSSEDVMEDILKDTEAVKEKQAGMELKSEYLQDNPYTEGKTLAGTVGEEMMKTGESLMSKIKQTAKDVGDAIDSNPMVEQAKNVAENVGDKVLDTGEKFMEKFGEAAEKVGEVVIDKGGEAVDKAQSIAEELGSKILKAKDDLMTKAEAEASKSGDTMDSILKKAKDLADKMEEKVAGKTDSEFADTPIDLSESELDKKDSFWEKAEKFASGDYDMKGDKKPTANEGEITIQKDPDYKPKLKEGNVKGFDDLDGDGNELIDDAIVEE